MLFTPIQPHLSFNRATLYRVGRNTSLIYLHSYYIDHLLYYQLLGVTLDLLNKVIQDIDVYYVVDDRALDPLTEGVSTVGFLVFNNGIFNAFLTVGILNATFCTTLYQAEVNQYNPIDMGALAAIGIKAIDNNRNPFVMTFCVIV